MIDFELYSRAGENYNYVQKEFIKLKELLENFKTSEDKPVRIFLQGSYKNDTNIGRESDIDIVVYYENVFVSNIRCPNDTKIMNLNTNISLLDIQRYNNSFYNATYSAEQFKIEIMNYLKRYSNYEIQAGKKTIKCGIRNSDFVFDIVCAFQYRIYNNFYDINTKYIEGNCIYDQLGNHIINFPKQSYLNSVIKNKDYCEGNYKETVRIFKNIMKSDVKENFWIPSFALESLLYNISNECFTDNNKLLRCNRVLQELKVVVRNYWNQLLESNRLLFVKNISNLTQESCLRLINEIEILIQKYMISQNISIRNNNFVEIED